MSEDNETITVTCDNVIDEETDEECGWEWETSSNARRITCPSCQYKIENPKYQD